MRALRVEQLVIWQDQMSAVAHVEAALDVDAILDEAIDLGEQRVRIEHDAVAYRAAHAFVQDAAGNLVQDKRVIAQNDGMARVRAALIADHPIRALGEDIHELALALVAPLRTHHDNGSLGRTEHGSRAGWRRAKKYAPAF